MKSQWTLSIEKNTDNFHYKWTSPIHSFSMEGRHAAVTYCRPHFIRYNLFHYSCVCFIWKMLWSFLPSQKYIFPYLIKPYLTQHPFPCCCPMPPPSPGQGLPRLDCYLKSVKEMHAFPPHTHSIIQFKISGKSGWNPENEMNLGLVDWWDLALFPQCSDWCFFLVCRM